MSTTIFFEFITPNQAVRRMIEWIPELVVKDDQGVDVLLLGYSEHYSLIELPLMARTRIKRKADDNPLRPPRVPPSHIVDRPFALTALTESAEAVIAPLHDDLYGTCLRMGQWRTQVIATGIRQLPLHTVEMAGETVPDVRKAWQLIAEELDDPREPSSRTELNGRPFVRDGVRVDVGSNSITVRGRQGSQVFIS